MLAASDLRKGLKIEIDDQPYIITKFDFSKPGKGQALYRCRLKNMVNGNSCDKTYRSNDKFKKAPLTEHKMQFLYNQGDEYNFMDNESYEQVIITKEQLGECINYLVDNMDVDVLIYNGTPIGVTMPNSVTLTVTKADPWVKGDTSGTDTKPITVETGYELQVPPFVDEGTKIQIDTRTGEYLTRVNE